MDDNSRTVVEPVALGSQTLSDTELSSLALSHSNEQFGSSDYETLANIEAELASMNAEEVTTTEETVHTVIEESVEAEAESILPDVEMTEIQEEQQVEQIIYTTAAPSTNQNMILQTKPTLQRVPSNTAAQVCLMVLKRFYLMNTLEKIFNNKN